MSETTTPVEHVLVVPTLLFHEIGHFQGFNANVDPYLETLFDPMHTRYLARPEAEEDPSYKQLIPYCVFRCGDEAFFYTRGSAQGEGRLHAKRSIGVGGHISTLDRDSSQETYLAGMERELDEEIEIDRENASWPADEAELDMIWRKRLKPAAAMASSRFIVPVTLLR